MGSCLSCSEEVFDFFSFRSFLKYFAGNSNSCAIASWKPEKTLGLHGKTYWVSVLRCPTFLVINYFLQFLDII